MSFNILLVEDSPTDAEILQVSLESLEGKQKIHVLTSGIAMVQKMEGVSPNDDLPHLILLDLNLPHKSGHELLKVLKTHPVWGIVPVIILSSSSALTDIRKSYALHANAYIIKPKSFDGYQKIAKEIYDFWMETAALPQG